MEKEIGQIKVTETDDGYRVEVKGKDLKALYPGCCLPTASACCVKVVKCEDSTECCPDEKAKK